MLMNLNVPGILVDGQEIVEPGLGNAVTITRLAPALEVAPSGGDFVVRIQDESGASPANHIEATILEGNLTGVAGVGALQIAAATDYYVRIKTGSSAEWLRGHYDLALGIGATSGQDLTTVSQVIAFLGTAGTGQDTLVQWIVTAVSVAMQTYMRRRIPSQGYVEKTNGEGETWLYLGQRPVSALTEIALEGDFGVFDDVIDSSSLKLDTEAGIVYRDGAAFPRGLQNVQATYTGGYTTIPADLEHAAAQQSVFEFRKTDQGGGRLGLEQKALADGGSQASYVVATWAPGVRKILDLYRGIL